MSKMESLLKVVTNIFAAQVLMALQQTAIIYTHSTKMLFIAWKEVEI